MSDYGFLHRVESGRILPDSPSKQLHCDMEKCGCGCTEEEYQHAVKKAAELVKSLGSVWESEIWENLEWHWSAKTAGLRVSENEYEGKTESFTASLGPPDSGGCWVKNGVTPKAAVRHVITAAETEIGELNSTLASALKVIDG